jgi:hypothetical protein
VETWLDENPGQVEDLLERFILFKMASMTDEACHLYASNGYYARLANRSERSVQRVTAKLERLGLIKKLPQTARDGSGRRIWNAYLVLVPESFMPDKRRSGGRPGGSVTPMTPSPHDTGVTLTLTPDDRVTMTSGCHDLREPISGTNLKEPIPPLPPVPGGVGQTPRQRAENGVQAIRERLYREHGQHLSRSATRACKRRLLAGEPVDSVWPLIAPRPPAPRWEPPDIDAEADLAWRPIRDRLRDKIAEGSFATWIRPLMAVSLETFVDEAQQERQALVLAGPTEKFQDHVRLNFAPLIRAAAAIDGLRVRGWFPDHREGA